MVRDLAAGLRVPQASTIRQGKVHVDRIVEAFGSRRLDSLRPSEIGPGWSNSRTGLQRQLRLRPSRSAGSDTFRCGPRRRASPLSGSRRTAPSTEATALRGSKPRSGRFTTPWTSVTGRACCWLPSLVCGWQRCAGCRVSDVDFMRGIVSPVQQYPADPLKTEMSRTPIPIPEVWR